MEIRGNIRVVCRCRPLVAADSPTGDVEAAVVVEFPMDGEIVVTQDVHRGAHHFEYDAVFGPTATQKDCFGTVKPMVTSFMDGYNVCIFAYGQSGAGKTHTMDGPATDRGCNWRAVEEVFLVAAQRQRDAEYVKKTGRFSTYGALTSDAPPQSQEGLHREPKSRSGKVTCDSPKPRATRGERPREEGRRRRERGATYQKECNL